MKKHNVYNACFSAPLFCKLLKRREICSPSGTPVSLATDLLIIIVLNGLVAEKFDNKDCRFAPTVGFANPIWHLKGVENGFGKSAIKNEDACA
ncbi:hypothetical protein ACFW0F_15320 [Brucella anthropi]|uniref:hypothetical protein n=1 Tax=Brucella anthropi TaxID=529 RepID=UPI00367199C2